MRKVDYFNYNKSSTQAEYYETLISLMGYWEFEIIEFKKAMDRYNEDGVSPEVGRYI